jgi:RHH-type transcriptional regulator, rel operon repressor / antitoxin RelB
MAISVRIPESIERRLKALAKQTGGPKAFFVREMIVNHIEETEDYYLAAAVIERLRNGREEIHTSRKMRADLGFDD